MTTLRSIAVVGGSLAGLRAVEALRRRSYSGEIEWIGGEDSPPYDRPPLSKQLLDGSWEVERVFFRRREGYDGLSVNRRFGRVATSLDLTHRRLQLDDGSTIAFDGLVIATGARARTLPLAPALAGVHTLRTLSDALSIRAALDHAPRVVVIGAGFIGLEVAAACSKRRLDVTVIDMFAAPLTRAVGSEVGRVLERLHRDHGVDFRLGRSVVRLEGSRRVEQVVLDDASKLSADLVIVGIGAIPETEWLRNTGLHVADGVVCDAAGFTGAPGVVAAGDVARWQNPLFDNALRVEHWTNATEHAVIAVDRLLDGPESSARLTTVPYFWSDQHDVKLQFVGQFAPSDAVQILEESTEPRRLCAIYTRKGRLSAALCFNRPALLSQLRALVTARAAPERAVSLIRP